MTRRKTEDSATTEDADIMAVVEATNPRTGDLTEEDKTTLGIAAETKPEAPVTSMPAAAPTRAGGTGAFFGFVFGGIVAACAGFGLARAMPNLLASGGTTDLQGVLAAQGDEIAALQAEIAARPDLEDVVARLAALEAAPTPASAAQIEGRVAALEASVAELKAQPTSDGGATDSALAADVAALREKVDALGSGGTVPADVLAAAESAEARLKETEARAAALAQEAEAAAAAARRVASVDRISAALDSGAPYASALADLGSEVPDVLAENASVGLPTVADLAEEFPEVARRSLEDALRANMGESWTDRVSSFLRSQTGLRSLSPKEGNDPDAILSRAEAALRTGDVSAAIAELGAMPEAGKPALTDWLAKAAIRVEAEAALSTLAQN